MSVALKNNPNLTQLDIDAMKPVFAVCYCMISHEFAIEDPKKILEYAEKIAEIFKEKNKIVE